jgi:DNA-binding LacI/PurR family transcriptional regulator
VGEATFVGARRPMVVSFPLSRDRVSVITTGADLPRVDFPVTWERLAGYRQAAQDAGAAWHDVVVAVCARNNGAEVERITERLLASPQPPDAIAAMSDEQAAGALRPTPGCGGFCALLAAVPA